MSIEIAPNEIHVWVFDLRGEAPEDRRQIGKDQLVLLCAQYYDTPTDQIEILKSDQGKPYLKSVPGKPQLMFNVSHSGHLLGFAFALDRQVGIDIEVHREVKQMDAMIKKYLPVEEQTLFLNMAEDQKTYEFFKLWVETEALAKCMGVGLAQYRNTMADDQIQIHPIFYDLPVSAAVAYSGGGKCEIKFFGNVIP